MKFSEMEYIRYPVEEIVSIKENILRNLQSKTDLKEIVEGISEFYKVNDKFYEAQTLAKLRNMGNEYDEFYKTETDYYNRNFSEFLSCNSKMIDFINKSTYKDELIKIFGPFYMKIMKLNENLLKSVDHELLIKEYELSSKYRSLISKCSIKYNDKYHNLSTIAPLQVSKDRKVRKETINLTLSWYEDNQDALDNIFDSLIKTRHMIALQSGFKNYKDLANRQYLRFDWTNGDRDNLKKNIKKYITPLNEKLYRIQKERLSYSDFDVHDVDFKFKEDISNLNLSFDETIGGFKEVFNKINPKAGELFNLMVSKERLDLIPRKGKGISSFTVMFGGLPFIFANMIGTQRDIYILTHEFGHCFQMYLSQNNNLDSQIIFPDLAESHSMSMELLSFPYMELFFKENADKYKYSHLIDCLRKLTHAAALDDFEVWCYDNPDSTIFERNQKFKEFDEYYSPYQDYKNYGFLKSGRKWQLQSHAFTFPLYHLSYAISQIVAFQIFAKDIENHSLALEKYINLCNLGCTDFLTNILKASDINSPFDEDTFKSIIPIIESYIDELGKKL